MEATEFNLQIEMFVTNNDLWEEMDRFYCVYNEGCFRNVSSGNCFTWKDDFYHIGMVEKNRYNSYDLVREANDRCYRKEDEALKALEEIEAISL